MATSILLSIFTQCLIEMLPISDYVRKDLGIVHDDPYGAFIARFLASNNKQTPLKDGGVLAYIVNDTFMTKKRDHALRCQMMDNYIHKMIRVHPDTFKATVNTAIIICERNTSNSFNQDHVCQMVDMTNVSVHDSYSRFVELLALSRGVDFGKVRECVSNKEYAIYYYPQSLIRTNSNLPFFVASPKLFALMNDSKPTIKNGQLANINFIVEINNQEIISYYLGDDYSGSGKNKRWQKNGIVKIISGIKTGDNFKYLFKTKEGRGDYKLVNENLIIDNPENLTLYERNDGINPSNRDGKFIVPLDKGGDSDAADGWMPNYYVPTQYYIDWSKNALSNMSKEAHSDLANVEFRMKLGITYSRTGFYAPTFRLSSGGILESKGCGIFSDNISPYLLLAILNSKLIKYQIKNYVMHTVESSVGTLPLTKVVIPKSSEELQNLVHTIIEKQKIDPRYDYASHEQLEIDKLVYEAYGLNAEDIAEVENWYARRYPKLSQAQKANQRKLNHKV
jgi:hypothetical protein